MATITLGGSTVVEPTVMDAYGTARLTKLHPIDGTVIIQTTPNVDSLGEKNAPRRLIWEVIPSQSSDWTHTTNTLKALEGTQSTLQVVPEVRTVRNRT